MLAIKQRFRAFHVAPPRLIYSKKAYCLQRDLYATKIFRLRFSLEIALEKIEVAQRSN